MRALHRSWAARSDIVQILAWSRAHFGLGARARYRALLVVGTRDIQEKPHRPESRPRPELGPGVRSYHLRHSRDRAGAMVGRVSSPRHVLYYRLASDGRVELGRVLHDAMEASRHVTQASFR